MSIWWEVCIMSKLLAANFARLRKNKVFWICMILSLFLGIYIPIIRYMEMEKFDFVSSLDSGFFFCAVFIGIFSSVFCSLFIGTEYSDGTIRNKIVIGHSRKTVYLTNFIVCGSAGLFMCLTYFLAYLCVGIPLLGFFKTKMQTILLFLAGVFMMSLALTALYTLIAMLCQNKALTSVLCILSAFLLLFAGVYIDARLNEPATYPNYTLTQNGTVVEEEEIPNPRYLEGQERQVYEFFYDFLPGGQTAQYSKREVAHPKRLILYSLIITVLTSGCGILLFRKKDLK